MRRESACIALEHATVCNHDRKLGLAIQMRRGSLSLEARGRPTSMPCALKMSQEQKHGSRARVAYLAAGARPGASSAAFMSSCASCPWAPHTPVPRPRPQRLASRAHRPRRHEGHRRALLCRPWGSCARWACQSHVSTFSGGTLSSSLESSTSAWLPPFLVPTPLAKTLHSDHALPPA